MELISNVGMDVATSPSGGEIHMKNFGRGIGGALLTLAFIFGISAATSSTAQAQYRNDNGQYHRDGDRDRNNSQDNNRDWRRNRNRDRQRDQDWQRNRQNGNYGRNNGNYGNNGYYGGYNNQYEVNRGYQEGLNTGASDAQRGQSFNPQRSHFYKNASSQAFRQGFVQGYNQGFRQYAGYNNGSYRRRNTGGILGGIFGRP
jgi:hypothetical protein